MLQCLQSEFSVEKVFLWKNFTHFAYYFWHGILKAKEIQTEIIQLSGLQIFPDTDTYKLFLLSPIFLTENTSKMCFLFSYMPFGIGFLHQTSTGMEGWILVPKCCGIFCCD